MANIPPLTTRYTLEAIANAELLRFEPTTYASGVEAPYYFDLRRAQSYPREFRQIANGLSAMVHISEVGKSALLAGIPEAGTPFASVIGYNRRRRLIQPRKIVKDYGKQKSIEGVFQTGEKVILIDDVVSGGESKITAARQIEEAGLSVEEFIVLIDHEMGGIEVVKNAGYNIRAMFSVTTLLKHLYEVGKITEKQYEAAVEFIRG